MSVDPRVRFGGSVLPALVLALAVGAAMGTGLLSRLEWWAGDELLRLAARIPPVRPYEVPDVAIVALDRGSLESGPAWPWPYRRYGEMIRRLEAAGARAIVFDIDFSETLRIEGEAELVRAIADSNKVILASYRRWRPSPGGGEFYFFELPNPRLAERARSLGSVAIDLDRDGVARRCGRGGRVFDRAMVSLAEAALAVAIQDDEGVGVEVIGQAWAGREEEPLLDLRRAFPRFPVVSAADLLEGHYEDGSLAGRVIFVGVTAPERQPQFSTPLGAHEPRVYIQAIEYRTRAANLAGLAVLRSPSSWMLGLGLIAFSLALVPSARLGWGRRVKLLLLVAGAGLALSAGLLISTGLLVNPIAPLLIIAGHTILGSEVFHRRWQNGESNRAAPFAAMTRLGAPPGEAQPATTGALSLAISLLGDLVGASGASILCLGDGRRLDGRRINWGRRHADGKIYDTFVGVASIAEEVLSEAAVRVFESGIPGCEADRLEPGSAVYLPLQVHGRCEGVLIVECRERSRFSELDLRTIATMGAQLALTVHSLRQLEELRSMFSSAMAALANLGESGDRDSEWHGLRSASMSSWIATRLELSVELVEAIELGALLHDIGKIGIPNSILNKPDELDHEERRCVEEHPRIGAQVASAIQGLPKVARDCILHHHECWDGTGYPEGLSGEEIPLGARIVAIVDVWDVLTSERPFKQAIAQESVREQLAKGRGAQFDPELLDFFLQMLEDEGPEIIASLARKAGEAELSGPLRSPNVPES